jgi:ribose/xylose/arabinose/galactoside ABC-type transport system permease subunit
MAVLRDVRLLDDQKGKWPTRHERIGRSIATASATMGSNILVQAAPAAIVGGVALGGGIGSRLGVAMGVLILTVLNNGLGLLNETSTQIHLVNGLLLLIVVLRDGRLDAALAAPLDRFGRRKATTAA